MFRTKAAGLAGGSCEAGEQRILTEWRSDVFHISAFILNSFCYFYGQEFDKYMRLLFGDYKTFIPIRRWGQQSGYISLSWIWGSICAQQNCEHIFQFPLTCLTLHKNFKLFKLASEGIETLRLLFLEIATQIWRRWHIWRFFRIRKWGMKLHKWMFQIAWSFAASLNRCITLLSSPA